MIVAFSTLHRKRRSSLLLCFFALSSISANAVSDAALDLERADIQAFVERVGKHESLSPQAVERALSKAQIKQPILQAISKPVERTLDWQRYSKIFLQPDRIQAGAKFMRERSTTMMVAESRYGVPREIITAIIGVETKYGKVMGSHRVLDALATLAFEYPKRSKFFTKELEHYLLLCAEQGIDPSKPLGSYAGAMGYGQFMPSSYREYAVDFDGDGKVDIWNNKTDAIGSVANYLARHGWRKGGVVVVPAERNNRPVTLAALNKNLKPGIRAGQLPSFGFKRPERLSNEAKVALFRFKSEQGPMYELGLQNFYVITRYNHSRLYARAVFELSQRILAESQEATASR